MAYNKDFYQLYKNYLKEPTVRKNHDYIFGCFGNIPGQNGLRVMDLGCGLGEYHIFGRYTDYVGIDLNNTGEIHNFMSADYHDLGFVSELSFEPNAFVSLFSIECCNPAETKYALYNKLFEALPSLQFGLAGGFFYENKRGQETVGETGGIVSWQTIEDQSRFISPRFSEFRAHIYTPSEMFGKDVVEVWKFLIRR